MVSRCIDVSKPNDTNNDKENENKKEIKNDTFKSILIITVALLGVAIVVIAIIFILLKNVKKVFTITPREYDLENTLSEKKQNENRMNVELIQKDKTVKDLMIEQQSKNDLIDKLKKEKESENLRIKTEMDILNKSLDENKIKLQQKENEIKDLENARVELNALKKNIVEKLESQIPHLGSAESTEEQLEMARQMLDVEKINSDALEKDLKRIRKERDDAKKNISVIEVEKSKLNLDFIEKEKEYVDRISELIDQIAEYKVKAVQNKGSRPLPDEVLNWA